MTIILLIITALMSLSALLVILKGQLDKRLRKVASVYAGLFGALFIGIGVTHAIKQDWFERLSLPVVNEEQELEEGIFAGEGYEGVYEVSSEIERLYGKEIKPEDLPESVKFEAPLIQQYPELPRGCEVTSLAMMLQHAGVDVTKTRLAKQVKKDATPFKVQNGEVYFGNPNNGFVGDMYSRDNPGYGVYHKPIYELAQQYLPNQVRNLTGGSFTEVLYHVSRRRPVWVITNTSYQPLPQSSFQKWKTPDGPIKITFKEHSVIITGYDSKYIYFNDPLHPKKNNKAPRKEFKQAWEQMGKQAITYIP
ncbi:C39 family peptidase [Bacillus tianshenii]|nr:C39 family peptidase [Bacillus tianshenii]